MLKGKFRFLFINTVDKTRPTQVSLPPLGLGYLISSLRKKFSKDLIEFKIINSNIKREIKKFKPDIVGITSVSQNYNLATKYAKTIKKYGLPVIIGGIHITSLPSTLTNEMDLAVMGEGEETIIELFDLYKRKRAFNKKDLKKIKGIAFREKGQLVLTEKRKPINPLDKIPMPARDLMTINKSTTMFTSRGCPYRCVFCASSRFWGKVRFFSAEYVVKEIKHLFTHYNVNHIGFWDDLFVADRKRLRKIFELLKKEKLLNKLSFGCTVRSNLVDEKLVQLLAKMNFKAVSLGLESASPQILRYLKGETINVDNHLSAIKILKKYRIEPNASFIIGSPKETKDEILRTLKFIKKNPLHSFDTYILTPFPGTPVWQYAKKRGLVSENMDWNALDIDFQKSYKKAVILSEKLSRQELFPQYLIGEIKRRLSSD